MWERVCVDKQDLFLFLLKTFFKTNFTNLFLKI